MKTFLLLLIVSYNFFAYSMTPYYEQARKLINICEQDPRKRMVLTTVLSDWQFAQEIVLLSTDVQSIQDIKELNDNTPETKLLRLMWSVQYDNYQSDETLSSMQSDNDYSSLHNSSCSLHTTQKKTLAKPVKQMQDSVESDEDSSIDDVFPIQNLPVIKLQKLHADKEKVACQDSPPQSPTRRLKNSFKNLLKGKKTDQTIADDASNTAECAHSPSSPKKILGIFSKKRTKSQTDMHHE